MGTGHRVNNGLGLGYTTVQFCTGLVQWAGHWAQGEQWAGLRVYEGTVLYRAYTMNWALGTG